MGTKMKGGGNIFLWFYVLELLTTTCGGQHSPFSLQAAVDELHRQEYPLNAPPGQQPHIMAGAFGGFPDQDYVEEDAAYTYNTKKPRPRLNKQLAKYLEREKYEADHGGLTLGPFGGYEFDENSNKLIIPKYRDDRKRSSVFRERNSLYDDLPASLFRERESHDVPDHSELTDQFLREIEKAQEHERQDRYKEALRNLWEKYQQQENQIEGDIFEEQKKRMRMPPYYMLMQKKRSYPVLPWLPYDADRKKRFPVSKRSTIHMTNDSPSSNLEKTDENVERELSELFGTATDEKKKRSLDSSHIKPATTHAPESGITTTSDKRSEMENSNINKTMEDNTKLFPSKKNEVDHQQHSAHLLEEHKHRKRSNNNASHESHEDSEGEGEDDSDEERDSDEDKEEHNQEHNHKDEQEGDEDDEDETIRKKKRSSKKKRNTFATKRFADNFNNVRSKKSIDWTRYFGLDRKKKAMPVVDENKDIDVKKKNDGDDSATSTEDINKKKRKLDPVKLENMNKKLQAIEDFIINETIKYTGAHEGIHNPEEIQRLKDRVLSRLATAYSLEKMRRALEKLHESVDNENHLVRNIIESDADSSGENNSLELVKKDKSSAKTQLPNDEDTDVNSMKKKMKKNNGFMRYPDVANEFEDFEDSIQSPNRYETLNDAYLGNKNYILGTNQCPIIESMAERCRGVDLLSGDVHQELLPLCGVHQLCYLCGTSQIACDYQYLSEADGVCGNNNECQAAARSVLMILRGTSGPQLGPRECIKNSCLYSAMREIGL